MTVQLAYAEHGVPEGVPVLFASSIGSSRIMWSRQVDPVSARRWMIAFDHRGHGASPVPEGPYEIADLAADVVALMDARGIVVADFVGLSLGAMVGMHLAAHHPDRIRRLVLACTTPYMPPPDLWIERAAKVRAHGMSSIVDHVLGRWFTPDFSAHHPDRVAPLREQFLATAPVGYAECGLAISRMDLRGSVSSIVAPTLVIAGDADPATTPATCRALADSIDGAAYAEVAASHIAAVEAPDAFTDLILTHLTEG